MWEESTRLLKANWGPLVFKGVETRRLPQNLGLLV